jgi:hypothetical protein
MSNRQGGQTAAQILTVLLAAGPFFAFGYMLIRGMWIPLPVYYNPFLDPLYHWVAYTVLALPFIYLVVFWNMVKPGFETDFTSDYQFNFLDIRLILLILIVFNLLFAVQAFPSLAGRLTCGNCRLITYVIDGRSCPSNRGWYCTEAAFTDSNGTQTHQLELPVWQSFFNRFVPRGSQITFKVYGYEPEVGCALYIDGQPAPGAKEEHITDLTADLWHFSYAKCTYTVP